MHSAIVAPKEMTRILLHFSPSCDNGIEFVTTSSSISDLFNLSIAGPESTGWVIYAFTPAAPWSFNALAALHNVPAVSMIGRRVGRRVQQVFLREKK